MTGVAALLVLGACLLPARSAWAQTVRIEGTYDIYDWNYSLTHPWTTMTIFNQTGDQFSVKGAGWTGQGTIHWMSGWYDWTGPDGKTRRTAITVRTDGAIEGLVTDKDNPSPKYNWNYVAKPHVAPMASSRSGCDRVRNDALPACEQKATPGEKFTCTNDTYVRWLNCLDSIPY